MAGHVPKGEVIEEGSAEQVDGTKFGIIEESFPDYPEQVWPNSFDPFNSFDVSAMPSNLQGMVEEEEEDEAPWTPGQAKARKPPGAAPPPAPAPEPPSPGERPAYVTSMYNDTDYARLTGEKDGLKCENSRLAAENAMLMRHCTEAAASAAMAAQWAAAAGQQNQGLYPQQPMPPWMPAPGQAAMPFPGVWGFPTWGMQMPAQQQPAARGGRKGAGPKPQKQAPKAKKQSHAAPKVPAVKTTVVLRNTPTDYTRTRLIELLRAQSFEGQFDFVYVPFDFEFNKSVGFAFVNLTSSETADRFTAQFEGFNDWGSPGEWKDGAVNWASPHQGFEAHVEHFRNSPVMHETVPDEQKPAIFKDSVRVPFPEPTAKLRAPRMRPGHVAGRRNQFSDLHKGEQQTQGVQAP